jgi:hypothetical protein
MSVFDCTVFRKKKMGEDVMNDHEVRNNVI